MAYLDVWRSGTFPEKQQVSECTTDCKHGPFPGFKKPLYSCTKGMCHSSTHPGTSYHVTQFYQAFPHVSTASEKCWDEKAGVRGYLICTYYSTAILAENNILNSTCNLLTFGILNLASKSWSTSCSIEFLAHLCIVFSQILVCKPRY